MDSDSPASNRPARLPWPERVASAVLMIAACGRVRPAATSSRPCCTAHTTRSVSANPSRSTNLNMAPGVRQAALANFSRRCKSVRLRRGSSADMVFSNGFRLTGIRLHSPCSAKNRTTSSWLANSPRSASATRPESSSSHRRRAASIINLVVFIVSSLPGIASRRVTDADFRLYFKSFRRSRQYSGRRCWWPTARTSNSSGNGA